MKPRKITAKGPLTGVPKYQKMQEGKTAITPLSKPMFTEEELREVWDVLCSGWVSKGPKASEFEMDVESYLGINHAIAVTNCTSALHLACMALDVNYGNFVVVPNYTFPATAFAVEYCNAVPVLCEVDPQTYNMDPKELEMNLIRYPYDNIKAIIVVHAFGQCADMDKIIKIANKYSIPVIEDAACAMGAKYKGKFAGTFGDIGCFSFHARKGITTGEGGMVVTNNHSYADKMRKLSEFGVESTWTRTQGVFSLPEFNCLGYNYKMSDITAAVGVVQMRKLDFLIKLRRAVSIQYSKVIKQYLLFLDPVYEDPNCYHIFQSYVALIKPEYKKYRDWIIQKFMDNKVQANIGTYALHRQPFFKAGSFAISDDIFERAIALPMYAHMGFKNIIQGGKQIWDKLQKL